MRVTCQCDEEGRVVLGVVPVLDHLCVSVEGVEVILARWLEERFFALLQKVGERRWRPSRKIIGP